MKQVLILNGPNLNLLGLRETSIYGNMSFGNYFETLAANYQNQVNLTYYQSNIEGELINKIHELGFSFDGIILNAGAYTHTSIAIADAIAGVTTPVIEVHISNVYAREEFRHKSYLSKNCKGIIVGMGLKGYELALQYLLD